MTATPAPAAGLHWRPISPDDIAVWHRLVRAIEDADDPAERHTAEDLHEELTDGSWKDPAADSILGLDDDGVARAFGHVQVLPGDVRTIRAFCWGGVDPEWRGRGVGTALLAWQEELGRAKITASGRPAPGRVLVHTDATAAATRRLLERAGFAQLRVFLEVTRPLDADIPPVVLPEGLRLVPYEPGLSEAMRAAHNEAFADHWGSEPRDRENWERQSVGGRFFRPAWSFAVLDGDEVAAYSLTSAYEQDWEPQGYTSGWTDLLGVRRPWRRRGLGSALLAATMHALKGDGIERADLGVDMENTNRALALYTALGYRETRRGLAYGKDVPRPEGDGAAPVAAEGART